MQIRGLFQRVSAFVVTCCILLLSVSVSPLSSGPALAAGGGYSVSGNKIVGPSGGEFIIAGINWYGFETKTYIVHGLYSKDYKFLINRVKQLGFNTIRLPFSSYVWETNPTPGANGISACPDCKGKHSRDDMALIVNYAGSVGLHVILDNHRSDAGNSAQANGMWYLSGYPESAWINDWVNILRWTHGVAMSGDTVTVNYLASDG